MFQLCELSLVFFSLVRGAFAANVDLCSVLWSNLQFQSFPVILGDSFSTFLLCNVFRRLFYPDPMYWYSTSKLVTKLPRLFFFYSVHNATERFYKNKRLHTLVKNSSV